MTTDTADQTPSTPAFTAAAFRRGLIAGFPFLLAYGVPAVLLGIAYKGVEFGLFASVLFSLLVYSSTAQAVTLGLWTLPPPIAALILACVATNARYLVMGANLQQSFGRFSKWLMLPLLFFMSDASWMLTTADVKTNRPDAGYFFGLSLPGWIGWSAGTGIGYLLPLTPTPTIIAATAVLPLAFIAVLLPAQWRGKRSVLPWALSAAAGLAAAPFLGAGWAMIAGGSVGTLYSMVRGDHD
ncbi:AzlC family ABC transporter permease [Aestuariivirga litoralis]|uniref:AzlC family ABC transporter permease n=1 Tax=Aestuariivirga litoralis TaxID=2650924 RepID=UPI0018C83881|nr:AzlC family ABC transporter permease [Aestuariivirga litoralis]MBG1232814.1 hypothetical protein [Aestuariivirga litoralis]